ncbi:hypothetical protein J4463_04330 [Candidatus Pacearchaeota archaeon]|nr:hypothetical protein [Candidatus Pacearchaeota archaeon]
MAKKSGLGKFLTFLMWLTGVIVALAVGFALTGDGTLTVPYLDQIPYVLATAGWIVILSTIIGVIIAIIDALS